MIFMRFGLVWVGDLATHFKGGFFCLLFYMHAWMVGVLEIGLYDARKTDNEWTWI